MRILFDARMINATGIGTYVRNVLYELSNIKDNPEVYVLMNRKDIPTLKFKTDMKLMETRFNIQRYSITEQIALPYYINKIKPDLAYFPNFNTPLFLKVPFVVTIHDMIHYLFSESCPNKLAQIYVKTMLRHSAINAKIIVTDSNYSKNDIVRYLGVKSNKVRVVVPGVSKKYRPSEVTGNFYEKYCLPNNFLLYVGSHQPRKNIIGLLRAFKLSRCRADYRLVVAGKRDGRKEVYKEVEKLSLQKEVIFTDFVALEDMPSLYSAASLFVFPSFYEGFGLPPLEAMACGTAVICSNRTSLPEVVGEAALTFDPSDTVAMAEIMDTVLYNKKLKEDLISKGFSQVKKFSWQNTAQGLLNIYKEAANL